MKRTRPPMPWRRFPVLTGLLGLFLAGPRAAAQWPSPVVPPCWHSVSPGGVFTTVKLPGGGRLRVGRVADTAEVERACRAEVQDDKGEVRWAAEGFGAELPAQALMDLTGDGREELLIRIDTGGGNRCCWGMTILALHPTVRLLADLPFVPYVTTPESGTPILWQLQPFYGLGPSMAESPVVWRVRRFRGDTLEDVTTAWCGALLAADRPGLPRTIGHSPTTWGALGGGPATSDDPAESVRARRVAVLSIALQHLACGQSEKGRHLVGRIWSGSERDSVWKVVQAAGRSPGD